MSLSLCLHPLLKSPCLSLHSPVHMSYMHHFCIILARGRAASRRASELPLKRPTPKTSTKTCARVPYHSRCFAGALGAHFCHPRRVSWHQLVVKADPKAPLGAPWRAPARSPSARRALKTLTTHAATPGRVERRARTHFGAFGTRVFALQGRQNRSNSTAKRGSPQLFEFCEFFKTSARIRLLASCACR